MMQYAMMGSSYGYTWLWIGNIFLFVLMAFVFSFIFWSTKIWIDNGYIGNRGKRGKR